MNKKNLNNLIMEQLTQVLSELAKPEANEDDPFGQYLFGSARKDKPASSEADTELEKNLWWALDAHIVNNSPIRLRKMISMLVDLKKQGKYAKYLVPPRGKVYRVVNVNKNNDITSAANMLGTTPEEIRKYPNEVMSMENIPHEYTPRKEGAIASWTTNPEFLEDFYASSFNLITILLEADTSSSGEFLLNPKELIKIVDQSMKTYLEDENEVISVGPVQVTRASFYYVTDFMKILTQNELAKQLIKVLKSS